MWGRFSDRYGRRPALIVGLTASAIAYVIFAYSDSLWLLFLSRLVQGSGGGTVSVIQAYVADARPARATREGARLVVRRDQRRCRARSGDWLAVSSSWVRTRRDSARRRCVSSTCIFASQVPGRVARHGGGASSVHSTRAARATPLCA